VARSRAIKRDDRTRGQHGAETSPGREGKAPATPLSLDRLIHERTRLGIVSALAASGPLTFLELKRQLALTDGNLSVHARRLEDAGYVDCTKSFAGRIPRTEYRLTELGRKALGGYLSHMEAVIKAARRAGS
jgi:DNA-binding HxlR family transcriptional regulator